MGGVSRRTLVMVYALLGVATYGLALLPGDPSIGRVDWPGIVLWAVLLWFLARGSTVAWVLALAATLWTVLALGFIGMNLTVGSAGLVVVFALQLLVLFTPSMRPRRSDRRAGASVAH